MSDTVDTPTPASLAPAKKGKATKTAKPRTKPTHPPTSEMVLAAIKNLNERNGSSLQAIKKYVVATYKVDVDKQAQFVKKFLVKAVNSGTLVRTKGNGASGSFRLTIKGEKAKFPRKAVAKKSASAKKVASPKKVTTGEKAAVATKKPTPKKVAKKPAAKRTSVNPVTAASKPKKSIAKKTAKSPAKPKAKTAAKKK